MSNRKQAWVNILLGWAPTVAGAGTKTLASDKIASSDDLRSRLGGSLIVRRAIAVARTAAKTNPAGLESGNCGFGRGCWCSKGRDAEESDEDKGVEMHVGC